MEARSSRSSREDNDITAKRPERFRLRIQKRSQDESSLIKGDTISGSGKQPDGGTSGSGLWSGPFLHSKRDDKRSMSSNSLDSLIATLRAISSLTPEENDNSDKEIDSSGSGLWLKPDNAIDDKLPQFFKEEASSGSGEDAEKALNMLSETAQMELSKNGDDVSSGLALSEPNVSSEEKQPKNGGKLFRREVKSDSLADDLVAAAENDDKNDDSEQEDRLSPSSGSADQEQEAEDEKSQQPDEDDIKTTRALADALLPDAFFRVKRSSQEDAMLLSESNLGENDALVSNSLVARFYRDQDTLADAPDITEASVASLPSETEAVPSTDKQVKPVRRESYYDHSEDFSEPRVVYTREITEARDPIIERPAVYSQSMDESEMDSNFGGDDDDDDDEATLMIHEREIREDGMVKNRIFSFCLCKQRKIGGNK